MLGLIRKCKIAYFFAFGRTKNAFNIFLLFLNGSIVCLTKIWHLLLSDLVSAVNYLNVL